MSEKLMDFYVLEEMLGFDGRPELNHARPALKIQAANFDDAFNKAFDEIPAWVE